MSTTTLIAVTAVSIALVYYVVIPFSLRLVGSELRRRTIGVRQKLLDDSGVEESTKGRLVGFFHPYCNAGGGGERVLWAAIRAIQLEYPNDLSVVYTGDHDASKEKILENVQTRFSIELDPRRVTFLYLRNRNLVAANSWPHFTLLGQSLGSLMLAAEAFCLCVPDIFIDTMGYAFTLRLAKSLFNIPTCAYVHYPTISTDMLGALPGSDFKTRVKRAYWQLFAAAYTSCGNSINVVMANSSWTAAHMRSLWKNTLITTVFPPCAVSSIEAATPPSIDDAREKALLCIAQFRPEKNHSLLINAFALFMEQTIAHQDARLVLLGSVRHKEDAMRVYELRLLAREKGVAEKVIFVTDAPWSDVQTWLGRAWAGVNGMWNEHFGIGVVEYLAAGLVGVVHNSGGPKLDIVVEGTGYHCSTEAEFAAAFETALSLPAEEARQMRLLARETSKRFSEETFEKAWLEGFAKLKTA